MYLKIRFSQTVVSRELDLLFTLASLSVGALTHHVTIMDHVYLGQSCPLLFVNAQVGIWGRHVKRLINALTTLFVVIHHLKVSVLMETVISAVTA
jgi:hypothetical protein